MSRLRGSTAGAVVVPIRPRLVGRPRLHTVGSTHDDIIALQTRLKDLSLALSLVVESCRGTLDEVTVQQWGDLAGRVLKYVSEDAGLIINTAQRDAGLALADELNQWPARLAALGCKPAPGGPVPTPIPVVVQPPPSSGPSPFGDLFKGLEGAGLLVVALLVANAMRK
jgi:hypothetical protein